MSSLILPDFLLKVVTVETRWYECYLV